MITTNKIIMLPTNNRKAKMFTEWKQSKLIFNSESNISYNDCQYYELYILSNDEIKEGDWMYKDNKNYIIEIKQNTSGFIYKKGDFSWTGNMGKIIASTDNSLELPSIPESFIKAYIKAYNEDNPITEVQLEWEETDKIDCLKSKGLSCNCIGICEAPDIYKLKTREDNTVIIRQFKDYSRNEVVKLLCKSFSKYARMEYNNKDRDKWIEENLN